MGKAPPVTVELCGATYCNYNTKETMVSIQLRGEYKSQLVALMVPPAGAARA
jgi:hypothetical protein